MTSTATPHRAIVTVGDWSEDGHNHWVVFEVQMSHPIADVQAAYAEAVKELGLCFDDSDRSGGHDDGSAIVNEYQDNRLTAFHCEVLRRYAGFDKHFVGDIGPEGGVLTEAQTADLFVWFCGTQIPGFTFTKAKRITKADFKREQEGLAPTLNGWWGALNISVGYGLQDGRQSPQYRGDATPKKLTYLTKAATNRLVGSDLPEHRVRLAASPMKQWNEILPEFVAWVEDKCEGRVMFAGGYAYLESRKDAANLMLHDSDPTKVG